MQIPMEKLLQMIGEREVEIAVLREQLRNLMTQAPPFSPPPLPVEEEKS